MGLGFCFFSGQGWEPRVSRAQSLMVNLKHKRGNFKVWEEKKKNPT